MPRTENTFGKNADGFEQGGQGFEVIFPGFLFSSKKFI
jgi:hypothetical protein